MLKVIKGSFEKFINILFEHLKLLSGTTLQFVENAESGEVILFKLSDLKSKSGDDWNRIDNIWNFNSILYHCAIALSFFKLKHQKNKLNTIFKQIKEII